MLLAVVLLAGCGSTPPPAPDDPASDQPADTGGEDGTFEGGTDDDDVSVDSVVSVSMTQLGGLTGVVRSWRITERHPRHGHVFAAAERELLEDTTTRAADQSLCCDPLEYEVVVRYADGSTKRLRTGGAEGTDPALQNLVTAVIDSEPWYPDRGGAPLGGRTG